MAENSASMTAPLLQTLFAGNSTNLTGGASIMSQNQPQHKDNNDIIGKSVKAGGGTSTSTADQKTMDFPKKS